MTKKEDFQKFLEKKFQVEKTRDQVLKKDINGLELTFIRTAKLERKAYSLYKDFFREFDANDNKYYINIGTIFTTEMTTNLVDLLYQSCPELQNSELHKALEIRVPEQVIDVLFDTNELFNVGFEVLMFITGQDLTLLNAENEKLTQKK